MAVTKDAGAFRKGTYFSPVDADLISVSWKPGLVLSPSREEKGTGNELSV